jgi:hypothetical protein
MVALDGSVDLDKDRGYRMKFSKQRVMCYGGFLALLIIIGSIGWLGSNLVMAQQDLCGFESIVDAKVWQNTDFCNHQYSASQFLSGGVPRDGIPPIYPQGYLYPENITGIGGKTPAYQISYQTIEQGNEWLTDVSPVLVVEVEGESRAYPLGILTRHEIANTEIAGVPVAVTFCPLCNTGIAFRRELDGQVLHFGVSGYLRNSDLVMWDHETESWWQQATGEGVVGTMAGKQLEFLSASMVSWGEFKSQYPDGSVLAPPRDDRFGYDYNPYAGYDSSTTPFLYRGMIDDRLPAMERVLSFIMGDTETPIAVVYPFSVLESVVVANDSVGGVPVVVFWQPGAASALDSSRISESEMVGSAMLFERTLADGTVLTFIADGTTIKDEPTGSTWNIFGEAIEGELAGTRLTQRIAVPHFWFAANAFHPDSVIWEAETTTDDLLMEATNP